MMGAIGMATGLVAYLLYVVSRVDGRECADVEGQGALGWHVTSRIGLAVV